MRRLIHKGIVGISGLLVIMGLVFDLSPVSMMGFEGKVFFYLLPMLLLFVDLFFQWRSEESVHERKAIWNKAIYRSLVVYGVFLLTLLFWESEYRQGAAYMQGEKISVFSMEYMQNNCNFLLFHEIRRYLEGYVSGTVSGHAMFINVVGNMVVFMPLGFYFYVLCSKHCKYPFIGCLLATIGISMLVEFLQWITRSGQADVDDVLLNVLGAIGAYGITAALGYFYHKKSMPS